MNRKGSSLNGLALIMVGLILFSLPTVYNEGIDDFGLAATEGLGLAAEFPPWENRTDTEMNVDYLGDSISIVDGETVAMYESLELTNEPDEFRLIELDYNTSIYETDSSITVNVSVYQDGGGSLESQTFILDNNTGRIDLEERLVGERLKVYIDLERNNQNDLSPVLHDMNVSVKTADESDVSGVWQRALMLAIIGFSLVLTVLLLGG